MLRLLLHYRITKPDGLVSTSECREKKFVRVLWERKLIVIRRRIKRENHETELVEKQERGKQMKVRAIET